jgi:hypothetical protein
MLMWNLRFREKGGMGVGGVWSLEVVLKPTKYIPTVATKR